MSQHRDNSNKRDMTNLASGADLGEHGHPSGANCENSQMVGSSVMVYTHGTAPMVFTLAFRPAGAPLNMDRDLYTVHPRFQMELGNGTLSILDPVDDLLVTHGAKFDGDFDVHAVDGDPMWWRVGWAFRWLQAKHDFYACPEKRAGLRRTTAMIVHAQKLAAEKKKKPACPWLDRHVFGNRKKRKR
jgi:hypothetical protein